MLQHTKHFISWQLIAPLPPLLAACCPAGSIWHLASWLSWMTGRRSGFSARAQTFRPGRVLAGYHVVGCGASHAKPTMAPCILHQQISRSSSHRSLWQRTDQNQRWGRLMDATAGGSCVCPSCIERRIYVVACLRSGIYALMQVLGLQLRQLAR